MAKLKLVVSNATDEQIVRYLGSSKLKLVVSNATDEQIVRYLGSSKLKLVVNNVTDEQREHVLSHLGSSCFNVEDIAVSTLAVIANGELTVEDFRKGLGL